jgi:hypothetical protein
MVSKMKEMAGPALENINDNITLFSPEVQNSTATGWRMRIVYHGSCGGDTDTRFTSAEAVTCGGHECSRSPEAAPLKTGNPALQTKDLKQEDVLILVFILIVAYFSIRRNPQS